MIADKNKLKSRKIPSTFLDIVVFGAALLSTVLGFIVILGHYLNLPTLVQILPEFAPMQFNTALGFFLSGIGLLAIANYKIRLGAVLGAIIALLGLFTISQYIFGIDLGIDQFFRESHITVRTTQPGRMAPSTAISFFLTGLILFLMGVWRTNRRAGLLSGILGIIVLGLGIMAIFGYLLQFDQLYRWGELTRMALHTAIGFIILGLGMLAEAWRKNITNSANMPNWFPALLGLGCILITLLLWSALRNMENKGFDDIMRTKVLQVSNHIAEKIRQRILPLEYLAQLWGGQGDLEESEWREHVSSIRLIFSGYQAIEWVDSSNMVRWVEPGKGNREAINLKLDLEDGWRSTLEESRNLNKTRISPPIDLVQGGRGFLVVVPVFLKDQPNEFILGLFKIDGFFEYILDEQIVRDYSVAIFHQTHEMFTFHSGDLKLAARWARWTAMTIRGSDFRIGIWPNSETLDTIYSPIPFMVLVGGLLLSMLVTLVSHLDQTNRRRTVEVLGINRMLAKEIVDRKQAEEALVNSEQSLSMAQKISRLGNWEWDIPSGALEWSEENYRILGLDPKTTIPTYEIFMESVHPGDREMVQKALNEALSGDIQYNIDHRIIRKDGTERIVNEQGEVFRDHDGQPVRMFGTIHDITERKEAENIKNEFVSTVSHELRTPITSILGSLGLILGHMTEGLSKELKEMLDIAHRNSERLVHMINDLLDIQKIESGKMELQVEPVSIGPLLDQAVINNKSYADQYGVRFDLKPPLSEIYVSGDSERLMQVIVNLLSNAAKFSPENSSVEIEVEKNGGKVRVSVIDHGQGIPESFHDNIFEKFTQADASDSRQKGGTGLGLSISKSIIERLKGEIGFVTKEGEGSTFYFELPVLEEKILAQDQEKPDSSTTPS